MHIPPPTTCLEIQSSQMYLTSGGFTHISWHDPQFFNLGARPTIMHREPISSGTCAWFMIDKKQHRGAINQWICYGGTLPSVGWGEGGWKNSRRIAVSSCCILYCSDRLFIGSLYKLQVIHGYLQNILVTKRNVIIIIISINQY